MNRARLVTENLLDQYVRERAEESRGVIVELILLLATASVPRPTFRRFPLGDSIGQPGPDGHLIVDAGLDPYIPDGTSYWQIGTNLNPRAKATDDYRTLTEATPPTERKEATFLFVTPLSARHREWEYSWKTEQQESWIQARKKKNEWKDVRLIDGTILIDWLFQFPAVELWLASKLHIPSHHAYSPDTHWETLSSVGAPPPLSPQVFLTGRTDAQQKLASLLSGTSLQLRLDTHHRAHVADFVAAHFAALAANDQADDSKRCVIVTNEESWNAITHLREPHVLVADFDLDSDERATALMLTRARRHGHGALYCGPPGGEPHPNSALLPSPKASDLQAALEASGYTREKARSLSTKCEGNLGLLLKRLQNLSLLPDWAIGDGSSDLVAAMLAGRWDESSAADKAALETLAGKPYGEWIETILSVAARPGAPLTRTERGWRFALPYEGWLSLGARVTDTHIARLIKCAVLVLGEVDPRFDMPPEERHAAALHDKTPIHSGALRKGLAQALALLGSLPAALTSASRSQSQAAATICVRQLLTEAEWRTWASLDRLLPLLAEAAPLEFLDAMELALISPLAPMATLFAQERPAFGGGSLMAGVLWALETLAWSPPLLTRVTLVLGEMAAIDPGGTWTNRPANSLRTIYLPWHPQTVAPIEVRKAAVTALAKDQPNIAWKLLLGLLPQAHSITMGSHRPLWREYIPTDWSDSVTQADYWKQIEIYSDISLSLAATHAPRLCELVGRAEDLPPPTREKLFEMLESDTLLSSEPEARYATWQEIGVVVAKHKRHPNAQWAMPPSRITRLEAIHSRLTPSMPSMLYRNLFDDRDVHFADEGPYQEKIAALTRRRQEGVLHVYHSEGIDGVLALAHGSASPWRVGIALGALADNIEDGAVLPHMLSETEGAAAQLSGGFVRGRFHAKGWQWVDTLNTKTWPRDQTVRLLTHLPFVHEAWTRASAWLGDADFEYWQLARANAYEGDRDLAFAVGRLIDVGRAQAALLCLAVMLQRDMDVTWEQCARALRAFPQGKIEAPRECADAIVELFAWLQADRSGISDEELQTLEWMYLPLLDRHRGAQPRALERRLENDPAFFCYVITLLYKPEHTEHRDYSEAERAKALHAYRLLSEWRTAPGRRPDGTVDEQALVRWVAEVKKLATEAGRTKIALQHVGKLLAHLPPEPGGFWIATAAAQVLNERDATEMRRGFTLELFNSRGVHAWTAGEEELSIARHYRDKADVAELRGYPRLADAMRQLADSYERDTERQAARDTDDDD